MKWNTFLWIVITTSVEKSLPWWPCRTMHSVYSIHASSSYKKVVVMMRVSLHFLSCEDHQQSGSDLFCLVSYETWRCLLFHWIMSFNWKLSIPFVIIFKLAWLQSWTKCVKNFVTSYGSTGHLSHYESSSHPSQ